MYNRKALTAIMLGTSIAMTACNGVSVPEATKSHVNDASVNETTAAIEDNVNSQESSDSSDAVTNLNKIDNTKWLYNEKDNVYYQLGIQYCENPADTNYEELAIIVPAAYMDATDNGDGTYTCTLNTSAEVYGSDVDYSFVWGQEHTKAERSGDSTTNFIEWVNASVKPFRSMI